MHTVIISAGILPGSHLICPSGADERNSSCSVAEQNNERIGKKEHRPPLCTLPVKHAQMDSSLPRSLHFNPSVFLLLPGGTQQRLTRAHQSISLFSCIPLLFAFPTQRRGISISGNELRNSETGFQQNLKGRQLPTSMSGQKAINTRNKRGEIESADPPLQTPEDPAKTQGRSREVIRAGIYDAFSCVAPPLSPLQPLISQNACKEGTVAAALAAAF